METVELTFTMFCSWTNIHVGTRLHNIRACTM